jgi:hypothetical protein
VPPSTPPPPPSGPPGGYPGAGGPPPGRPPPPGYPPAGPAGPGGTGPGGDPPGGWAGPPPAGPGGSGGFGGFGGPPGPRGGGNRRGLLVTLAIVAVIAVVAVGALVRTGGDDDGGDADGPPAGITLGDLEGALLTLDDVGSDYEVDPEGGDEGDDILESDSLDTSEECRTALETFEASESEEEQVSAYFVNDRDGTVQHDVSLPGEGQPGLDDIRRAVDQCGTVEFEDDGTAGTFGYSTTDTAGLGDNAFALVIEAEVESQGLSVTFEMYGVMWERDGVVSSLSGFAGFDEETFEGLPTDRDEVESLAAVADERLAGVLAR